MVPKGRFDFGSYHLVEGIGLLPAVIGLFAICELLVQAATPARNAMGVAVADMPRLRQKDFIPDFRIIREIGAFLYVKSSIIGVLIGMLPGGGAAMASFIAYAEAKRTAKRPEAFGDGSHEGLAASESANNAMCGGAIISLLTMGIPGDAVTAIIFGVLLIHGLVPGPGLLVDHTATIAPMFAALFVASAFVMVSVLAFGPYYLRLARINRGILYAFIALVSMAGVYASSFSGFQMWMALAIGIFAFALRRFDYPVVPMLMGVILGPYLEEFLPRSLIVSKGDPSIFITSPFSLLFLILTDARTVHGIEEALRRAEAYVKAGADILFIEAPESEKKMETICSSFDVPMLANMVEGGRTPVLSGQRLAEMGYALAIYPTAGFLAAAAAMRSVYGHIVQTGISAGSQQKLEDFQTFGRLMGFEHVGEFDRQYTRENEPTGAR
ncbi:tripartite tricarboxylate transporter permease [Roseovarius sp. B08]|uniref:tripartite tricarboxylate transporter permease n=1 Tax=Roseovarius sp. B08 TaxID=3449223 RepID=UPI003EDBD7A7